MAEAGLNWGSFGNSGDGSGGGGCRGRRSSITTRDGVEVVLFPTYFGNLGCQLDYALLGLLIESYGFTYDVSILIVDFILLG